MSFVRKIRIEDYSVDFAFMSDPTYCNEDTYVWGFPYKGLDVLLNSKWDCETLNQVAGYYIAVRIFTDKVIFANDILGGYRCYYYYCPKKLYVSDNYESLLDIIQREKGLYLNKNQYLFWQKHRYTLNEGTLIENLYKFSPASIYTFDSICGLSHKSYFSNVQRRTNSKKLKEKGFEEIKKSLQMVYNRYPDSNYVLFYSGGDDSTFLLFLCMEIGIPLNCIVIKYKPAWSVNQRDIKKAIGNLDRLCVPYKIVEVDLLEAQRQYEDIVVSELLFDRHLAVHFYKTYESVVKSNGGGGRETIIINGQSADSILSFGPSEFTKGNMAKRTILAFSKGIIGFVGKRVSSIINCRYIMPSGIEDSCKAIMDDDNYIFALNRDCKYDQLLNDEFKSIKHQGITHYEAARMYAKIIGFLQGSDNQVVIKAALHNGIDKVVMPFTSPDFIYSVVKYKNNYRDIFKPKYFVRDILKTKYKYSGEGFSENNNVGEDFDMNGLEDRVMKHFIEKIDTIVEGK